MRLIYNIIILVFGILIILSSISDSFSRKSIYVQLLYQDRKLSGETSEKIISPNGAQDDILLTYNKFVKDMLLLLRQDYSKDAVIGFVGSIIFFLALSVLICDIKKMMASRKGKDYERNE